MTKPRPTLPKRPGELGKGVEDFVGIRRISYVKELLSLAGFSFALSYAMEFIMSFLIKLMKIRKTFPTKVCLRMG